jgi:hypothetical protein
LSEVLVDLLEDYASDWIEGDIRPLLADEAKTAQFLASKGVILNHEAMALFLDCVLDDFKAALRRLKRLASGDYRPDERPTTFPPFTAAPRRHKQSGFTRHFLKPVTGD